jgi:putative Mg2+ transporter-C (MgtC) family protein
MNGETLWGMARVALAMLLGGGIGLERELAGKPAGLRTHILVATAAAALVVVGDAIVQHYAGRLEHGLVQSDPLRVVGAVITGISFLGAGSIIRGPHQEHVEGLTTAASVLVTAAVGIAAGAERPWLALAITVMTVAVLRGLEGVKRWIDRARDSSSKARAETS